MNSSKTLIIILAVIILGVGIWFGVNDSKSPMGEIISDDGAAKEGTQTTFENDTSAENKNDLSRQQEVSTINIIGSYENYSPEKIARAAEGKVLIFFHATWCPTCRAADKNITENIASIPDGVHILKADYDNETALKQKYGVTTQHTFVQVDANGEMITKFSGQRKLADILSRIK